MDAQWLKAQFELYPNRTKAALARALGLEPPAISKILNGTRQIKAAEYVAMRGFFGLPSNEANAHTSYVLDPLEAGNALKDTSDDNHSSKWVMPAQIFENHTSASSENIKSFRVEDNMMAPSFHKDEHVLVDLSDKTPSPPGAFILSDGFGFSLRNCEFVANSNPAQIKVSALKDGFESKVISEDGDDIVGRVIAKLQWL